MHRIHSTIDVVLLKRLLYKRSQSYFCGAHYLILLHSNIGTV